MSRDFVDRNAMTQNITFDKILNTIYKKIWLNLEKKIESQELTWYDMFKGLGEKTVTIKLGRLGSYDKFVDAVIDGLKTGQLSLKESSWGRIEVKEDAYKKNTSPGIDDFFPASMGWNSYGGPTYEFVFGKNSIVVKVNFMSPVDDEECDYDTQDRWQTRKFKIEVVSKDKELFDKFMSLVMPTIQERYHEMLVNIAIYDFIDKLADEVFDHKKLNP